MNLLTPLSGLVWKYLPSSFFQPKAGDRTTRGLTLSERPSLSGEDEMVKFAAFSDARIRMRQHCRKLIPFLPEGFEWIDDPNGQNCFMYSLGVPPRGEKFGRREFDAELERRLYLPLEYHDQEVREGDIVVYSVQGIIDRTREHAAVYMGDGRVRSRWGIDGPLIEHPLKEVISIYWDRDDRTLSIERPPQL